MQGQFTRVSPASFADRVEVPLGWFVISHRWMPDKKERRQGHGKWYRLSTANGSVYRVLRFSVNLEGTPDKGGQIVLDWPAWLDLHGREENVDGSLTISIIRARWYEYPGLAISHPDPAIRWGSWIAVLSLALGVISVILAVWALCMAYAGSVH